MTAEGCRDEIFTEVAAGLLAAYSSRTPVEPPRDVIEDLDVAGAYKIQQLQEATLRAGGHKIVGRKVGLTSKAMQKQLGVDSPDFGFFTESMVLKGPVEADRFIAPKIEPELGFRLAKDLPAHATVDQVAETVDAVFLAVEIIDSRVRDWDIRLVDTIADNASCGAVFLSDEPIQVRMDELNGVSAVMRVDGRETGRGSGIDVMGNPLAPIAWLTSMGVELNAGDIVLSGSFCGAAEVSAGSTVDIDYGKYGTLNVEFV